MSSMYHEIIEALIPLVSAFEQFGIAYYIGGSVSSSFHSIARRTQDIDVIADIKPQQVRLLVPHLQNYYLDEAAWIDAVRRGLSYNVIYLDTIWNDIIGVLTHPRATPLDLVYLRRWADVLYVRDILEQALAEARL